MALIDKLDDLRDKATELAQSGVAISKQLADIAKLKTDNMAEEDAIRKACLAIGKLYFELHGEAPEAPFTAECDKIRACQARIAANNIRLAELKDDGAKDDDIPKDDPL